MDWPIYPTFDSDIDGRLPLSHRMSTMCNSAGHLVICVQNCWIVLYSRDLKWGRTMFILLQMDIIEISKLFFSIWKPIRPSRTKMLLTDM